MWIQKLFEILDRFWDILKFWFIIDPYEQGVVLRLGKYNRNIDCGFNFKYPLIENVITVNVVPTTMNLSPQSLTTRDAVPIAVSAIVKYSIKDIKIFTLDVYDAESAIGDICMGKIAEIVVRNDFSICMNIQKIQSEINVEVKKEALKWGVKILNITLNDFQKVRSLRLLLDKKSEEVISYQ